MERKSGILMPITSLPSPYGIGCFSKEAYDFVDFLEEAGQTYWQILPLGQTGYGDSPYQSFSTFAGNPYFIDLDSLVKDGYLKKQDLRKLDCGNDKTRVDYEKIYNYRFTILKKAYQNSPFALEATIKPKMKAKVEAFQAFVEENESWLPDYALYCAVKNEFNGKSYNEWDEDIRVRKPEAVAAYKEKLADQIRFYEFLQFMFEQQWAALKLYANHKGIKIVGDIPIYVAFDSADTWANPELFQLDENGIPTAVAGCPPDAFSETGQLWGNPLYRWDYHKETEYEWWMRRLRACFQRCDVVRIDHFRAFDEYYAIPYGDPTAEFGTWQPGPGIALFETLNKVLGAKEIIAEDLGFLTPTVLELVAKTGYPGMKVLQFAFDDSENSDYLPHKYPRNCVVYTGTHDNDTMVSWIKNGNKKDVEFSRRYLNIQVRMHQEWEYIRAAFASVADTAIIPMQDYLGLGNEARMNMPSTLGGNWEWRMSPMKHPKKLAKKIYAMTKLYGRL